MDHPTVLPTNLTYHLLEEITDGFSEERKLGSGGYGKVYLAVQRDGQKSAVKVLYDRPELQDNDEQFLKEFNNLTGLRHHNIVRLIGYCNETRREFREHKGKTVFAEMTHRVLCFEFMQNGSLDKYLYDEYHGDDWHTRYATIKGICMGLKYLHEELIPPIYHLDLKPTNILLDENMVPKIADFGLSRFFGEEQTRITQNFQGTLGYLPPEFIERNIISNKFDIFSLGVIIVKIMTGPNGYSKCAEMPSQQFIDVVHENWRNRIQETLPAYAAYCEQVQTCIQIALSCIEVDRSYRPSIGDIVNTLNKTETMIHELPQFTNESTDEPGSMTEQTCPGMCTENELRAGESEEIRSNTESSVRINLAISSPSTSRCDNFDDSTYDLYERKHKWTFSSSQFKYRDLAQGTNNFSKMIGEDSFSAVFSGMLKDQDGQQQQVAVKMFKKMYKSSDDASFFLSEVSTTSQTRHKNVVRLKGWCRKSRWLEPDKLLLVYELVPNGNLDEHLHKSDTVLQWRTRYKIVKGITSALVYLHHECQPYISHGVIKPKSIHLDDEFNPKLANFDLSWIADHNDDALLETVIRTIKYMDPNCVRDGNVDFNRSCDVYSFGIVLLEIACKDKPMAQIWDMYTTSNSASFVEVAPDERLGGHFDRVQMERVIVLGLWCSLPVVEQRPSMLQVMRVLEQGAPLPDLSSYGTCINSEGTTEVARGSF